jgi:hypothetical protein
VAFLFSPLFVVTRSLFVFLQENVKASFGFKVISKLFDVGAVFPIILKCKRSVQLQHLQLQSETKTELGTLMSLLMSHICHFGIGQAYEVFGALLPGPLV